MKLLKFCTQNSSKLGKLLIWSILIPTPKKGNAKLCSNYHTIAFISHASKVLVKILHTSLQQYLNLELPNVKAKFSKVRGTRSQSAKIFWIIE